ncbi:hypothetical protein SAMN04487851_11416 [Prevotella sp. tc2-28]|uniref:hypothetical protein n=1 Tax=Prevotella sp. tc2-28 TaxID=1761888 RepID=UPI000898AD72|nr:hypothetical protein [Prevotella sp. tc2-28]SEA78683.1 hypothetical protein SAMN04487851_11416 [Prevotella sp. tc2-28]
MATIRAYTTIEQSRKLAEILTLESADCFWDYDELQKYHRINWFEDGYDKDGQLRLNKNNVCAWSLASLLGVLPKGTNISTPDSLNKIRYSCWNDYDITYADNPVDACVAMIEKLHELKML